MLVISIIMHYGTTFSLESYFLGFSHVCIINFGFMHIASLYFAFSSVVSWAAKAMELFGHASLSEGGELMSEAAELQIGVCGTNLLLLVLPVPENTKTSKEWGKRSWETPSKPRQKSSTDAKPH